VKPLDPPDLLTEVLAFEAAMIDRVRYTPLRNPRCIYDRGVGICELAGPSTASLDGCCVARSASGPLARRGTEPSPRLRDWQGGSNSLSRCRDG
jgi:hypothetical protein